MNKLVYLFPAVMALGLAACGDDSSGSGTDGDESSTTDPGTTGGPTTDPTTGPGSSTTEDPTVDPTSGSDSSGGGLCDADDECGFGDNMCDTGFACVGCLCVEDGTAPTCPDGWGDGEYADCLENGNSVCTSTSGLTPGCVVDDTTAPTAGACYYAGCETACDCPAPPDPAFEDQVVCDNLVGDAAEQECFIDCSSGGCPDGMFCLQGAVCVFGEEAPYPHYEDCLNENVPGCVGTGICLSDEETFGACAELGCTDASDCGDAPDTGDAPPACTDFPDGMGSFCSLSCDNGETCPDGMTCISLAIGGEAAGSHCFWPPEVETGFGDCATQPDNVCSTGETCVGGTDATTGTTEVCAAGSCVDPVMDCPVAPETGDASVACQDIDGEMGDECVLDCSMGQTCPDGAVCTEAGYCAYEVPTFTFQEDFEGGVLPKGWVVQDVDGNTTAMETSFVDAAWVIGDPLMSGNQFAISTSWYSPGGISDDWLISPVITLGATATLQWNAQATDPGYADGYQVFVVPIDVTEFTDFIASGDPTAFLALDSMVVPSVMPVFEVEEEENTLQWRSVDLAGLATQEVYIAFRNDSDDDNLLLVDNIWVVE